MQRDHSADTERLKQAHENEANKLRQAEQMAKTNHQKQIEGIGK